MSISPQKTWWGRNWKWVAACIVLLLIGFVASVLSLVFGIMKSSDAYKGAVAKAAADPVVQKAVGVPMREGLFVTGSISVSGPSGSADLAIPISGPHARGTLYAVAHKSAGVWTFSTMIVQIDQTKERIDLLRP